MFKLVVNKEFVKLTNIDFKLDKVLYSKDGKEHQLPLKDATLLVLTGKSDINGTQIVEGILLLMTITLLMYLGGRMLSIGRRLRLM